MHAVLGPHRPALQLRVQRRELGGGSSRGGDAVSPLAASPLAINTAGKTKTQVTKDIIRTIYQRDGPRGFYRGYLAALGNYVPSSASWWGFYSLYQDVFASLGGGGLVPHTVLQCGAAVCAGCTKSTCVAPAARAAHQKRWFHQAAAAWVGAPMACLRILSMYESAVAL